MVSIKSFEGNQPWYMLIYCPIIRPEGQMYVILSPSIRVETDIGTRKLLHAKL